ncbi:hypothetical protein V6N13_143451 [Hibiscus sabdariffa]|uniref:Reverse transcriptase zinc-binding domain-containing protein n=1 Tax=Hibiscus sabdariffa TaxID=183260 RepID=A0ABR2FHT6_9ROSI
MPLPVTSQPDFIVWRGDKTGSYSVKSGYKVLLHGLLSSSSTSIAASLAHGSDLFNKIWQTDVPSKVGITIWRFIINYLPKFDNLSHRGIAVRISCLLCDETFETASHL